MLSTKDKMVNARCSTDDFPNPSCLIFGYTLSKRVIHVVAGCDEEYVYIITAYYPNLEKFSTDLKQRKEQ